MTRRESNLKASVLLSIVGPVVALDQWTKHIIHRDFHLGESVTVIPSFFDLTYLRNRGAAFSFLDAAPPAFRDPFFVVIPLVAMAVILVIIARQKPKQWLSLSALSLIFGGALGNLIDRLQLGYVVDFLYFHWKAAFYWPAFNVADSCIVVGVTLLFCQSLFVPPTNDQVSRHAGLGDT